MNNKGKKQLRVQGFTLIEILLAMAISTIIIAGINASYRQVSNASARIETQMKSYGQAESIIETLRQELAGLYVPEFEDANSEGAIFSVSQGNNTIELEFYTGCLWWERISPGIEMAKIRYVFEKKENHHQLSREVQLYSGEKAIGKESLRVISERIMEFDIQTAEKGPLTEQSWQKTYNAKTPPAALKVSLGYGDNAETDGIETIFTIRCGH